MSQPYDQTGPHNPYGQSPRNRNQEPKSAWGKIPVGLWVGLAASLVGFFLRLSMYSRTTTNGVVTQCTYFDIGAMMIAVICFVSAVIGVVAWSRRPRETRMTPALIVPLTALIGLLGAVHVLRGFGIIGGLC
ncbi:hypothetical protein [Kocuria sp.]|uniref:hypothetical protein n=1 Tax=Kocuria sp. TaxID=1871328 RepID=UPI0026DF0FA1|nr:hypothetical protein [Kocuria sp.]MDO5617246.1 hypothetical protein [Kocuria sp.]